jgi:hypothetical protein
MEPLKEKLRPFAIERIKLIGRPVVRLGDLQ